MHLHRSRGGRTRPDAVLALVVALAITAGCSAPVKNAIGYKELGLNVTYTGTGTEMTIGYTLPPAPPGKVYVLWLRGSDATAFYKVAVLPAGVDRYIRTRVDFKPQAAIVSIESSPDVTTIQGPWATSQGIDGPITR
ncbi:MAG: hypothetical protein HYY04_14430 [Chloroflexi bacterium]|nr:hypothetical protein [Chloroflexota bacterium]